MLPYSKETRAPIANPTI